MALYYIWAELELEYKKEIHKTESQIILNVESVFNNILNTGDVKVFIEAVRAGINLPEDMQVNEIRITNIAKL